MAIFDADKQGFLRSRASLIQVSGRAARNINGEVIMYADTISAAMREAMEECDRRRAIQLEFNRRNNIIPRTIEKAVSTSGIADLAYEDAEKLVWETAGLDEETFHISSTISELERQMELAARNLQFEKAALLRDRIQELRVLGTSDPADAFRKKTRRKKS